MHGRNLTRLKLIGEECTTPWKEYGGDPPAARSAGAPQPSCPSGLCAAATLPPQPAWDPAIRPGSVRVTGTEIHLPRTHSSPRPLARIPDENTLTSNPPYGLPACSVYHHQPVLEEESALFHLPCAPPAPRGPVRPLPKEPRRCRPWCDPPRRGPEGPPGEMALGQQQPAVACMSDQPAARLHRLPLEPPQGPPVLEPIELPQTLVWIDLRNQDGLTFPKHSSYTHLRRCLP